MKFVIGLYLYVIWCIQFFLCGLGTGAKLRAWLREQDQYYGDYINRFIFVYNTWIWTTLINTDFGIKLLCASYVFVSCWRCNSVCRFGAGALNKCITSAVLRSPEYRVMSMGMAIRISYWNVYFNFISN